MGKSRDRKQNYGCQWLEGRRIEETANEDGGSFWGDENVPKLDSDDGGTTM